MYHAFARLFFFIFVFPTLLSAMGTTYHDEYKQFSEPPFEKIYIRSDQLCTFSDGLYYFADDGTTRKVRALLTDYDGQYIIAINHQCPLCGRSWPTSEPDEDFGCPIFHRRYHPSIWSK